MRFRFRYSLRIFLLVWLVIGVGLGWFGIRLRQANRQAAAVAGMEGEAEYDFEREYEAEQAALRAAEWLEFQRTGLYPPPSIQVGPIPSEPVWLINLLGVDFFHDVVGYTYREIHPAADYPPPKGTKELCVLDLGNDLDSFSAMPYLTKVTINRYNFLSNYPRHSESIQSQLFVELGRLKYLTDLTIEGVPANSDRLSHLSEHARLRTLNLRDLKITDEALAALGEMPQLKELNLSHCGNVGKSSLKIIGHWRSLRKVNLRATACDDRVLAVISALPDVESLDLAFTRISPVGLKQLGNMKSLRELDLDGLKLGPADSLQSLTLLPLLERLYLRNAENLQAEKLKGLQDIIPLKYVDLAGVDATDEDLATGLQGWKTLEGLNLNYSKAGPKFASQVATLRALRVLRLINTPIARDKALQKELITPDNCSVDYGMNNPPFYSSPTDSGRF